MPTWDSTAPRRVKLRGTLERTISAVEITAAGDVVVELYDFSDTAERMFGNDVASRLTVEAKDRAALVAALGTDTDGELLQRMEQRFAGYFDVQEWLTANGVPFRRTFEPWA